MAEPDFREMEITVVGLGLIGGSYALALRKLNPKKLWAIDIKREVLEQAENRGIIDGGSPVGTALLKRSDLVIVSIYPELTIQFIKENLAHFKPGCVLTDTVGVKQKVTREVQKFLRKDLDFIGGHPLAGKEQSGFAHASSDIFTGANYIVTPVPGNQASSLRLVEKMVSAIGCKKPIFMDPAEHDEVIALTSQLPHLLAVALINSSDLENTGCLVGGSFRDATRVAKMNVGLWRELFLENRVNILKQMDKFIINLQELQQALKQGDGPSLEELLAAANLAREKF